MAALVADYGSDSEQSGTEDDISKGVPQENPLNCEKTENIDKSPTHVDVTVGRNLLITDESQHIIHSEINEDHVEITKHTKKHKLPNPLAKRKKKSNAVQLSQSVFVNPFDEAKREKDSVLEKHVKMTETAVKPKQICFKFKKGKCYFGKGCKFSHDLEGAQPVVKEEVKFCKVVNNRNFNKNDDDIPDDDGYMANMKRKRRTGVNDHLVPPKRAMDALSQQRHDERPWTMGSQSH